MRARHVAEPLLWLALAADVLWILVLIDLLGGFREIPEIHVGIGGYFWVPIVAGAVLGLAAIVPWPEPDRSPRDPNPAAALAWAFLAGLGVAVVAALWGANVAI